MNSVTNRNARILDLVLANDAAFLVSTVVEATEPLIPMDLDHPALVMRVFQDASLEFEEPFDICSYDFRKADYAMLNEAILRIDWHIFEEAPCIDDAVNYFCCEMNRVIANCVPRRRPPQKPLWANGSLRKLKRLRASALRKYCNNRSVYFKHCFTHASNRYRSYNRFLYKRYVNQIQGNLRRNPKQFWSFVNSKRQDNGLPTAMFLNQQSVSSNADKCNLFATHFKQAFNRSSATAAQVDIATMNTPRDVISFNVFYITENHVAAALQKLKHSIAAGPDAVPASVLKKCSDALIYPLTKLFNLSLTQAEFPIRWKSSNMFPVHKKGDKCNVANYRGITSLCACSKVFEIIINDVLFTSSKNYICTDQHGFYPKRSVATNLVQFVSLCLRSMDAGAQVDSIYTDLKAAFDRVDHLILLKRLDLLGVSNTFVTWFRSYLTNRTLCVKIGSSLSDPFSNCSGVPQGSNLGPLLFSLFINEVSSLLPPGCRLFYADDLKIFMVIKNIGDCQELQCLLNDFAEWSCNNMLTLSIEKCNTISFYRKLKPLFFDYSIFGTVLKRVDHIKDLGVILDRALTFKTHYNDIITRSNRQLGFIFKIAAGFRDPLCLRSLYCSLVRSLLEFSAVVWCPYQANWTARLESVQRKFVRYALRRLPWRDPLNLPPYEARCRLLGIETLERRREVAQIVFIAKVLTGEIDSPAILALISMYAPERPIRQRSFLHLALRNNAYGVHDPIRFMTSRFNEFYAEFDFSLSVDTFRQRLLYRRD